jgi:5-methylcytosine-specific restriction protein A
MRVCSVPGCPTIYNGTTTRCPTHQQEANETHWANTRDYNTPGHRTQFRPAVLKRDPICVICHKAPSTVADHHPLTRRELLAVGKNPNDPQYGRGLCTTCDHRQSGQRQTNRFGTEA